MIYVTGRGNSGTTFVVDLLYEIGFDLGDQPLKNAADRHGRELMWFSNMVRAENKESALMRGKMFPYANLFDSSGLKKFKKRMITHFDEAASQHGGLPELVKLPEEGQSLILDHISPDHTFVVIRDPSKWIESVEMMNRSFPASKATPRWVKENYMFLDIGRLIYYLTVYDLPFTIIEYPRAAKEPIYTWDKICPVVNEFKDICFTDYFKAYTETVDEEWIR